MTTMIELTCRDPIVSRDGRPFGAGQGNRMRSVGWPLPSVVAGALRTAVGRVAERDFSSDTAQELLQVGVAGVFPVADGQVYLPAPRDCIVHPAKGALRVTPQTIDGGGCDFPAEGLRPVVLTEEQAPHDFKPEEGPAWWPVDQYASWLTANAVAFDHRFLNAPPVENRTHVQLDPNTGAADEGKLFTTAGLPLAHLPRYRADAESGIGDKPAAITLTARVRAHGWCGETIAGINTLGTLGGERRLVHWKAASNAGEWGCPEKLSAMLAEARCVRMVLATPAIFRDGWKPGWLDDQLEGQPPGSRTTVKLVGASIARWRAVSGWSLADLPGQRRGPKPVRRMVPAGGVYFFEIVDGTGGELAACWLDPVSDDEQERRDGFGLAVWGVW